jgi:predicted alternative tryptophan synthase beta-subunit
MSTGRSSYVEMRALDRLTNHNIKTQVDEIIKSAELNGELCDLLTKIPQSMSEGYAKVLTPNGIVRKAELDRLLSIDADIVTYIGIIESKQARDVVDALKELMEERKRLVDSLKA